MSSLLKYTGGVIKGIGTFDDRNVSGFYTSSTVDLHGHIIDKNSMLAALDDYRSWGTVREMHETPIGTAKSIGFPEWNWIDTQVSSTLRGDEVMKLVRDNVYKAFSVGILVTSGEFVDFAKLQPEDLIGLPSNMVAMLKEVGDVFRITGITLVEVSIVDRPANPMARVQSVRNELGIDTIGALPSLGQSNSIGVIKSAIRSSGIYMPVTAQAYDTVHADKELASNEKETQEQLEVTVGDTENKELDGVVEPAIETQVVEEVVDKGVVVDVVVIVTEDDSAEAADTPGVMETEDMAKAADPVEVSLGATEKMIEDINKRLDLFDFESLRKSIVDDIVAALTPKKDDVVEEEVQDETKSETKVVLSDEQLKSLVDQVTTVMSDSRLQRKGAINKGGNGEVSTEPIDVKKMTKDELAMHLARAAAQIR